MIKSLPQSIAPASANDVASLMMSSGFNLVVQMPTGSGKTFRAANAIVDTCRVGYSAIYVAPTRALANELHTDWSGKYPNLKVGIFTGDYGSEREYPVPLKEANILIMTPERLDICTRQWRNNWRWLPKVDLVIVDEIHMLGDTFRGARLEGTVVRLRHVNPFARIIGLSATLGNAIEIANWLEGAVYQSSSQSIPIEWKYVNFTKADQKPTKLVEVIQPIISIGAKSLVFVQSKRRAEQLAAFLRSVGINAEHHHGGLGYQQRADVENRFRNRQSDVLVATSTLEVGLNLPVRQVVLYDIQQFDGADFKPLSVNSAWQRAGRAGRMGYDEKGEVVVFCAKWEKVHHYQLGHFEPIESRLVNQEQFSEQIIVAVAANYARDRNELIQLFSGTLAFTQGRLKSIEKTTDTMCAAGFLQEEKSDNSKTPRLRATPLGRLCSRLLIGPDTVLQIKRSFQLQRAWTNLDLLLLSCALTQNDGSISVDYEELGSLSVALVQRRSYLFRGNGSQIVEILSITNKRLIAAIKGALILLAWTEMESIEDVAESMSCYSNDVVRLKDSTLRMLSAMKAVIQLCAGDEQMLGLDQVHLEKKINQLELMVRSGLTEQASSLTLIPGIGKSWAMKLFAFGVTDLEDLAQASSDTLKRIGDLSEKRAGEWIEIASGLLSSDDIQIISDTADYIQVDMNNIDLPVDIYRLKRSWQLNVASTDDPNTFHVSGGADPHLVRQATDDWFCDCPDRSSGHVCKHLIAVRRWQKDPEIIDIDKRLLQQADSHEINLHKWWSL